MYYPFPRNFYMLWALTFTYPLDWNGVKPVFTMAWLSGIGLECSIILYDVHQKVLAVVQKRNLTFDALISSSTFQKNIISSLKDQSQTRTEIPKSQNDQSHQQNVNAKEKQLINNTKRDRKTSVTLIIINWCRWSPLTYTFWRQNYFTYVSANDIRLSESLLG